MNHKIIFSILKDKLKKEKIAIIKLLGISLISSGIVVIQPFLMQRLIDNALIPKDMNALYFWSFLIIFFAILGIAITSYSQIKYTRLSTRVLYSFRSDIFEKLSLHKKTFFQKYQIGDMFSRLEGDVSEIQRFVTDSIFSLTTAFLGVIGAFIIMFIYDSTLALLVLILMPLEFFALKPLYAKMSSETKKTSESNAKIGSFIIESLGNILFFKNMNYYTYRVKQLKQQQTKHSENIISLQKIQLIFSQVPVIIALLGKIFILFWAGTKIVNSQMQVGELIAFISYFGMVLGPIQTLLGVINSWPRLKVSLERLDALLPKEKNTEKYLIEDKAHISFENLCFSYGNKEIFNSINLYIKEGEKIFIKGDNGVGKSTLFELLLKNLDYEKGDIKISGISLKNIDEENLYNTISYVQQDSIIIANTLRENLKIAKVDAKDEELLIVLKKVGLYSWYESLNKGLDHEISENGSSLSGGQDRKSVV